jgi:hypothetical protein
LFIDLPVAYLRQHKRWANARLDPDQCHYARQPLCLSNGQHAYATSAEPLHVINFTPNWRSLAAGFCGSAAHSGLMFLKSQFDLLPSFHPYDDLQRTLSELVGSSVHPWVPWALSFLNGSIVLGFLFGRIYWLLPGRSGAAKGFVFGSLGWVVMGLLFFPMLGRGAFATQVGLGFLPALFSLLMVLSYSIMMGIAYSTMNRKSVAEP